MSTAQAEYLRLFTVLKTNMNKIIIFCKHAVETLTYFSMQLADAFEESGYEIFWIDLDQTGRSAWKLRQAVQQKKAVLITFNFIGLSGEEDLWESDDTGEPTVSLFEKLDIPCLNIMVDHPVYYYQALQYPAANLRTFCIDRDHVAYMHRFYPDIFCEFLPLAGNCFLDNDDSDKKPPQYPQDIGITKAGAAEPTFEQWMQRPYPLVFTANYVPVSNIDRQIAAMEPEYRDFYHEIIEAFLHNPKQDLLSCIETYLRREIPDLTDAQLCEGMSSMPAVDLWIRTYFREKTVRILAEGGIKIHLSGKDWDQIRCTHPQNLITTGHMVNSAACVQATTQAKIALNTMPWFKDGAHDRIFTAMLAGTAALTDDSTYLREQFTHKDTIIYYDLSHLEQLPHLVTDLLQHPEDLYKISLHGKNTAQQHHRWKHRAEHLKQYI